MSGYMRSRYYIDDDGNFENENEVERALENGDLEELDSGNLYDSDTGTVYWRDGSVKE